MINRILYCTILFMLLPTFIFSQEPFPVEQITFSIAQEGFASWSPDGAELVYSNTDRYDTSGNIGIWIYSINDEKHRQIYAGIAEHPQWSPDGGYIIFDAEAGSDIHLVPSTGGRAVDIVPDSIKIFRGGLPTWSNNGRKIAFMESEKMKLWIKDMNTSELSCIHQWKDRVPLPCCWTHDDKGVIVALMEPGKHVMEMWVVSTEDDNHHQIIPEKEGFYRYAALSPDGKWLAFAVIEGETLNMFVMPSGGGQAIRLTSEPMFNENPRWSPDGSKIAFTSTRSGNFDVWVMDVSDLEN